MYKVLQATCNNGNLILDEKLSNEWEGKSFQIIILETDEVTVRKKRFFDFVDQHYFTLQIYLISLRYFIFRRYAI